jgi:hypothetical protein
VPIAMSRPWKHPNSGVGWLRKGVPEDLRVLVGKGEEKRSLQTHLVDFGLAIAGDHAGTGIMRRAAALIGRERRPYCHYPRESSAKLAVRECVSVGLPHSLDVNLERAGAWTAQPLQAALGRIPPSTRKTTLPKA